MAIISNAVTIADAGAFSVGLGAQVLIKTLTISSSTSTVSFVDGASSVVLDDTYPLYKFVFTDIHPSANGADLKVGFRDGGSNYDALKTSTYYSTYHNEAGNDSGIAYDTGEDLAQSANFQNICKNIGNVGDEVGSGELFLFNPSSTTFVKHFMSSAVANEASDYVLNVFTAGYCNVTAAIDAVQFSMHTGTIDSGIFKLYGIKDS